MVTAKAAERSQLVENGRDLTALLDVSLPFALRKQRLSIPNPFSRLDLTQKDVLASGRSFIRRFPDRNQPLLLVGVRTSGTYFVTLLKALFEAEGYEHVGLITIYPNHGLSRREKKQLRHFAARGFWALIVDDPPESSRTLLAASDVARRAGFRRESIKFLPPTHPSTPSWYKGLPENSVITLLPDQWHKRELLDAKVVERQLREYLGTRNCSVSVVASHRADEFNAGLRSLGSDERGVRLKRVFEIRLQTPDGERQTKYVLAKSVGWGWLSYRAFLVGQRLTGHVPPVLGLRDGILYSEWLPQQTVGPIKRNELIDAAASYVAARVRRLNLTSPGVSVDPERTASGNKVLVNALSRAYGRYVVDKLMRPRMGRLLGARTCPSATLIDGNMHPGEWILGTHGPVKTDFEHHGMGKVDINVTDAAYDLADTCLNLALSPDEERRLIENYISASGDREVERRLFLNKLLAGLWGMNQSQLRLFDVPRSGLEKRDLHQRFMNAWHFVTMETARHCGSVCHRPSELRWRSPLIVLDIDGVLDRVLFGFPSTTIAGMKALSLLSAHGYSAALNTARSAAEVKEYCKAFCLSGGIAEYGSYFWDAVNQREQVLISAEAQGQLAELRDKLRVVPGVYLDERHQYSIKAFTYREKPGGAIQSVLNSLRYPIGAGVLAPISTHTIHELLIDLRLDALKFHHTRIDTAVVSKEVDKGTGLRALRDSVLAPSDETIAIGDDERDLPMFAAASRSYAPSNVGCRRQAWLFGTQISKYPNQRGLLDIIGKIIHPENERCDCCQNVEKTFAPKDDDLFFAALRAADQPWIRNFSRVVSDPSAFKIFFR